MRGHGRRASALHGILDAIDGVTSYEELGGTVLPRIGRWIGSMGWGLNRSTANEPITTVSTNIPESLARYRAQWFPSDPLNMALLRPRPDAIMPFSRLPAWRPRMERHPIYAEFAPSEGVRHLMWMTLSDAAYLRPGSVVAFFMRSPGERDFDGDDVLALAQVLPRLRTAERRCARAASAQAVLPALAALVEESAPGAHLIIDGRGEAVWMSADARRLLLGPRRRLPEPLLELAGGRRSGPVHFIVGQGTRVVAERRAVGSAGGEDVAVVTLRTAEPSTLAALRQRFDLTAAEAEVLAEIAAGRSNGEIAARRRVSLATVRTQVGRILDKLGVHTRLEAALVAIRRGGS